MNVCCKYVRSSVNKYVCSNTEEKFSPPFMVTLPELPYLAALRQDDMRLYYTKYTTSIKCIMCIIHCILNIHERVPLV